MTVPPLKKKTMTLNELQLRTLNTIRLVRFQLDRKAHEEGMSDAEFDEQVLQLLETDIVQDRHVLKMRKNTNKSQSPKPVEPPTDDYLDLINNLGNDK